MSGSTGYSKKKKVGLVTLAVLALFFLYTGIRLLPNRLVSPFHLLPPGASGINLDNQAQQEQAIEALKNKDTDGDGLSDYEELAIYKTSPYLEDTDSDGFTDKQEIDSGNDPNCPAGQDCAAAAAALPSSTNVSQENLGKDLLSGASGNISDQTGTGGATDWSLLQNFDMTPDQLRELLKQNGFSDEELAKIDDATLKEVWQSTLKGTSGTAGLSQSSGATEETSSPTATQLRKMLIDAGLDQKILEQLSDDELLKMYADIVKK